MREFGLGDVKNGDDLGADWDYLGAMRDHRSLHAWQIAREVAGGCIRLADRHWCPARGALFDQLRRAAVSVQLNLAEGYALGTSAMFRRHARIAYGSAVETTDALELLRDFTDLDHPAMGELVALSRRSQAVTLGLLRRLASPSP